VAILSNIRGLCDDETAMLEHQRNRRDRVVAGVAAQRWDAENEISVALSETLVCDGVARGDGDEFSLSAEL
jgi:hypothetical protein